MTDLENKIQSIIGENQEHLVDFNTRTRIADEIKDEVNSFIKNPYSADELKNTGMISLGEILSKDQVAEITEYFATKMVYNSHVPKGDGVLRKLEESGSQSGCYDPKDIICCPHLLETALSDKVLALVSSYMGCLPTLYSLNCFWTMIGTSQNVQSLHRDLDDWRFLTLLIYLVDVDDGTAPHIFITHTHDQKIMETVSPDLAGRTFPPNPFPYPSLDALASHIKTLTGPRGSGYLLDTFAVHRGSGNVQKRRLVAWFRYGLHKNGPATIQMPEPYPVALVGDRIRFNEALRYVVRVLLV